MGLMTAGKSLEITLTPDFKTIPIRERGEEAAEDKNRRE